MPGKSKEKRAKNHQATATTPVSARRRNQVAEWREGREKEGAFLEKISKAWTLESLLEDLGVSVARDYEQLRELLRLVKGKFAALDTLAEGLEYASDISKWKSGEFVVALAENRGPTLEEVVDYKQLSRLEVAAGLAAAGLIHGIDRARSILAATLPDVFRAAAENAVMGEGAVAQADRRLLFEASGVMPKGPNTIVSINNNNQVVQVGLPQWKESDKVVESVYFEPSPHSEQRLGLPSASGKDVIDVEVVEEKAVVQPR